MLLIYTDVCVPTEIDTAILPTKLDSYELFWAYEDFPLPLSHALQWHPEPNLRLKRNGEHSCHLSEGRMIDH